MDLVWDGPPLAKEASFPGWVGSIVGWAVFSGFDELLEVEFTDDMIEIKVCGEVNDLECRPK